VRLLNPVSGARAHDVNATFAGVGDPNSASKPAGTALSGITSSGSVGTRSSNFGIHYLNVSSFFQDTWKVSPRLTLTYGARYDIAPPPKGENGSVLFAAANVDNLASLAVAPAGIPLWHTAFTNIAPRVGLAYSLRRGPARSLIFRAGAGIFYDLTGGNLASQAITAPNTNTRSLNATAFPYSAQALTPPTLPASAPFATQVQFADPNLKTARTYQWNAALEQGFGASNTVSVTYVGAQGRHLARLESFFNPNATFTSFVSITRSDASSDYHALQVQFRGRFSSYLQALASYCWSHSLDTVSADTFTTIPDSRIPISLNRGSSDFDVRHTFTSALTFTVPKIKSKPLAFLLREWSLDGIFRARTAFPIDVIMTRNIGFGSYTFRPDIITGLPIYITDPSAGGGRRIDSTRPTGVTNQFGPFLIPTAQRQGSLGRNVIRGFGMYQADVDIRREFSLRERLRLQLKAEFFNLTNHPNFGDPTASLGTVAANGALTFNTAFGRSPSMLGQTLGTGGTTGGLAPLYQVGGPRSMQVALKLIF
jgi:hypothetical protein